MSSVVAPPWSGFDSLDNEADQSTSATTGRCLNERSAKVYNGRCYGFREQDGLPFAFHACCCLGLLLLLLLLCLRESLKERKDKGRVTTRENESIDTYAAGTEATLTEPLLLVR